MSHLLRSDSSVSSTVVSSSSVSSYSESSAPWCLCTFLRENDPGVDEFTQTIQLSAVPCLNGFLVCGDIVIYLTKIYCVEDLHYSFRTKESMAVLSSRDEESDYATVTVWSIRLALIDSSVNSGKAKMLPRPYDHYVAAQIFWAYANLRFILCHAPPMKNQHVFGATVGVLVGDQNETFRFAFGLPHLASSSTRVVYAPKPQNARERANARWDKILGLQWDKIRCNQVCYKMAISVIGGSKCSAVKQLKVTLFLSQQSTYKNCPGYREYCYMFVNNRQQDCVDFFRRQDASPSQILLADDVMEDDECF